MAVTISALPRIRELAAYEPGLSIDEIRQKYGLERIVKLASNENPLGTSPLVQEAIRRSADLAFRYPRGGNPELVKAIAQRHGVPAKSVVVGNGSDEIIDLLIRILAEAGQREDGEGRDEIVCFEPCFSIYPIQARIAGISLRRCPLKSDLTQDLVSLGKLAGPDTRLVFVTTPDNPTGYCPPVEELAALARHLAEAAPKALLVLDEAYMDFATDETRHSLLATGRLPENVAVLRTFSKSFGLAGLRLGYAILPEQVADCWWRSRLPFSVNILAEQAGLAALADRTFREQTMAVTREGRAFLSSGLARLGCNVWPSSANFLMFSLPESAGTARQCFEALLASGVIIRPLGSYGLPGHLRVSIGTAEENQIFLNGLSEWLKK